MKVTKAYLKLITLITTKSINNILISYKYAYKDNILRYYSNRNLTNRNLKKILLTPYAAVTNVLLNVGYITVHIHLSTQ